MPTHEVSETLRTLIEIANAYDIALTDANSGYRSTYDVMSDIAASWGDIGSEGLSMEVFSQQETSEEVEEDLQESDMPIDYLLN